MAAAVLERATFETSRAAEYFSVAELQAQTGQPARRFLAVVLKELADNGLDAAEAAGVAPDLAIDVEYAGGAARLCVQDNGPGIPAATVRRVLNYQTRTSDKAAYRSPTRGAQGNALKTIWVIERAITAAAEDDDLNVAERVADAVRAQLAQRLEGR